jgi:hypothetical protein
MSPDDVSLPLIPVAANATILYALAAPASGTLRAVDGEAQIELFATLTASLRERPDFPPVSYQLRFTTGLTAASNAAGTEIVTVEGQPVVGPNHVRLVGAATNQPGAFPGPGEAVYAVLSGRLDWLPTIP